MRPLTARLRWLPISRWGSPGVLILALLSSTILDPIAPGWAGRASLCKLIENSSEALANFRASLHPDRPISQIIRDIAKEHTYTHHVGASDQILKDRLKGVQVATSFTNEQAARSAIARMWDHFQELILREPDKVQHFLTTKNKNPTLDFSFTVRESLGKGWRIEQGVPKRIPPEELKTISVALIRDSGTGEIRIHTIYLNP